MSFVKIKRLDVFYGRSYDINMWPELTVIFDTDILLIDHVQTVDVVVHDQRHDVLVGSLIFQHPLVDNDTHAAHAVQLVILLIKKSRIIIWYAWLVTASLTTIKHLKIAFACIFELDSHRAIAKILCADCRSIKGPSIYYVIQIWGPSSPLPPYCNIVINWEDPPPCNIVINWETHPYVILK